MPAGVYDPDALSLNASAFKLPVEPNSLLELYLVQNGAKLRQIFVLLSIKNAFSKSALFLKFLITGARL